MSVIIPTYNRSAVLRYAIRSVLSQTLRDFELLVIGDGCTDDSETVATESGDPRVRWTNLPENTRHQSGPNNEGLRQARGEFIAYLGHDDLWLPHHLEAHVAALETTASDLSYSTIMYVLPDGKSAYPVIPRPERNRFGAPLCVVHRRRVTEQVGGWRHYREMRGAPEIELWRRAIAAGFKATAVPRFTGVKFPGSWRRDVYKTRASDEQAAWFARIQSEPAFEQQQLLGVIASNSAPRALPLRDVVGGFIRHLSDRVRIRLVFPWLGLPYRTRGGIDVVRRFKGL